MSKPISNSKFRALIKAMPVEKEVEFLGVDEIQLCVDRERGHIFSNRLLNARGKLETIFMGSETIKKIKFLAEMIIFLDNIIIYV